MPLHPRLPLLPENARELGDNLAIAEQGTQIVFFNAAGPIYACDKADRASLRLGALTMIDLGLAGVTAMAKAVGLHRTTLFRDARRMKQQGVMGLEAKKRGPKGPRLLTPDLLERAQELLDSETALRATAKGVGVDEKTIRRAVQDGRLTRPSSESPACPSPESGPLVEVVGPAERAAEDQASPAGVAVKRTVDRALACVGALAEAGPEFRAAEAVPGAGVLLAVPALLDEGLLEVGTKVYGGLKNGFFGLRSILLTFCFMALLRIKTPEQLTGQAPGELGLLLGLDRAPEVKTLRRKLAEMGERGLAHTFARKLTERWVKAEPEELGVLYVDGHVRPYNGRTHTLPKHHVQQRGRPMPGTTDYHVNDRRCDPLFFVTAEANEGLLRTMESTLLPEIRRLVGARRKVTIAFDREGWSPERFESWKADGFNVLTYRKGKQSSWRERSFRVMSGKVDGRKVEYRLAERSVKLSNGLRVREIRRLTDDGHQTSIITTNENLSTLAAAHRMFGRWGQENFFRYMEQEFDLNHLSTNAVEPADPKRLVTSPERAVLEKRIKSANAARARLLLELMELPPDERVRVGGKSLGESELDERIQKHAAEIEKLEAKVAVLPKKVPIDTVLKPEKIVQLERERKVLVDTIKLASYRAESHLLRLLEPLLARHEEEGRKFLQSVFLATADLLPEPEAGRLTVRFHGLSNPRSTTALAALCERVNQSETLYPGTDLRVHFEAPRLQN